MDDVLIPVRDTGLVVLHRERPSRALRPGKEENNPEHRGVWARVERAFARMKRYETLRDRRQHGTGLHHAIRAVAHMHILALAS